MPSGMSKRLSWSALSKTIATAGETKKLINKHNFKIKKKLGQNFIIDSNIIAGIAERSEITEKDISGRINLRNCLSDGLSLGRSAPCSGSMASASPL